MELDFPDPRVTNPWTGSNGVVYQYIGTYPNGYWTGHNVDETSDQLDARYVQVAGDNMTGPGDLTFDDDKIVLGIDGTAEFAGVTTHDGGVSVTGGDADATINFGVVSNGTGYTRLKANDSMLQITDNYGQVVPQAVGSGNVIYGMNATIGGANLTGTDNTCDVFDAQAQSSAVGKFNNVKGFNCGNSVGLLANNVAGNSAYGFYSELYTSSVENINLFNYYSIGNAPNFFKGDTYIGGTTSRNTRQLWESTLTEEQKEQLNAGTFTIPANVSTPGDGSFARQWWYEQQSAEDQALIDAGELEYPTHFQAANFVDTFELGVTTNINLLSNGRGEFKSIDTDVLDVNKPDDFWNQASSYVGIGESNQQNGAITTHGGYNTSIYSNGYRDDTNNWKSLGVNGAVGGGLFELTTSGGLSFRGSADTTKYADGQNPGKVRFSIGNNPTDDSCIGNLDGRFSFGPDQADARTHVLISGAKATGGTNECALKVEPKFVVADTGGEVGGNVAVLIQPQQTTTNAEWNKGYVAIGIAPDGVTVDHYAGFFADATVANSGTNVYGFYSDIDNDTNLFNFYAAGTAPNYFRGNCFLPRTTYSTSPKQLNGDETAFVPGVDNYHMINASTNTRYVASSHKASPAIHFEFWNNNAGSGRNVANISTDSANLVIENNAGGAINIVPTSDYRVKTDVTDLPSAVETIKQIRPISYINTLNPGVVQKGFIAHELQEHVPEAVRGTKDAIEAIGTLVDYDGTVLETEVTEPTELEYTEKTIDDEGVTTQAVRTRTWTATGTRPVYQGVDQTKLIPLLTKALQEALTEIDSLKQRLDDADIA